MAGRPLAHQQVTGGDVDVGGCVQQLAGGQPIVVALPAIVIHTRPCMICSVYATAAITVMDLAGTDG